MTHRTITFSPLCAALLIGWAVGGRCLGQAPPPGTAYDSSRQPLIAYDVLYAGNAFAAGGGSSGAYRGARFPLFRMPAGFLYEPVGLGENDDPLPEDPLAPQPASSADAAGDWRVQVALGNHNPFFDLRKAGDPGGVGYYQLHSQVELLDCPGAALSLGLQALTPAGLECDGLQEGPTFVSPSLAWFQDLGDDCAIHGFIGTDLRTGARWVDRLHRGVRCGLAVQSPVPCPGIDVSPNLHMFVEALGRLNSDGSFTDRSPNRFEVLPGLHWRMNENCWLSGGVSVPVDTPRLELWQITCSWRF
jgi:hypothetical protein